MSPNKVLWVSINKIFSEDFQFFLEDLGLEIVRPESLTKAKEYIEEEASKPKSSLTLVIIRVNFPAAPGISEVQEFGLQGVDSDYYWGLGLFAKTKLLLEEAGIPVIMIGIGLGGEGEKETMVKFGVNPENIFSSVNDVDEASDKIKARVKELIGWEVKA